MTDTTKLLDGFEDWLAKWEKTMGEKHLFHDVAAFARIGASVMPRPIDDDAKTGEAMLCWCDMEGVKFIQVLTYDRVTPIHPWYDQEGVGYHAAVPLFYVPAKSLPKPTEVTT